MDEKKKFSPPPLPKIKSAGIPAAPKPPALAGMQGAPKPPMLSGIKAPVAPARPAAPRPAAGDITPQRVQPPETPAVIGDSTAEKRIHELQNQLLEEREKLLLQTIRSKEEDAAATKVEDSIRQIQEKLRREKNERDLHEQLEKAENKAKELEKRLGEERETWVATIKGQMSQRDSQEKDFERSFELRIRDIEKKWHEEKDQWTDALRGRDEEITKLKNQIPLKEEELNRSFERKMYAITSEKMRVEDELKAANDLARERAGEISALKAEAAMINSESSKERERAEKLQRALERMKNEGDLLLKKIDEKEKDYFVLKTQASIIHAKGKAESDRLVNQVKQLEEETRSLKQQHQSAVQAASSRESELKSALERAVAERFALDDKAAQKDQQIKTLEAHITDQSYREKEYLVREAELNKDLKKAADELEASKTAANEVRNRMEDLQKTLLAKEDEIRNIRRSKDDEIKGLAESKNAEAEKHAAEIKNLAVTHSGEIKQVKDEYEKRVSDAVRQTQDIAAEKEKLNAKIIEMTASLAAAGQRAESAEKTLSEETRKMLEAQREVERVQSELTGKIRIIDEMKLQLSDVDKEISERIAIEEREYKRRLERLEQINDDLHRKLAQRDDEIKETSEKFAKTKAEVREITEKYEDKAMEINKKYDSEIQALRESAALAARQNEEEISRLRNKIAGLSSEHLAIRSEKDEEIESLRDKMESEKNQARDMARRYEDEIKSLRGQLGERNEKVHSLSEEIKLFFRKLEDEKAKGETETAKASQERAKCDREIENLNRIWDSKVKSNEVKLAETIKKQKAEIETIRQKAEEDLAKKNAENENIVAKLDSTWKEFHSRFLEEYKVMESRLQEKDNEIRSLQQGIDTGEIPQPEPAQQEPVLQEQESEGDEIDSGESGIKNAFRTAVNWLNKPVIEK